MRNLINDLKNLLKGCQAGLREKLHKKSEEVINDKDKGAELGIKILKYIRNAFSGSIVLFMILLKTDLVQVTLWWHYILLFIGCFIVNLTVSTEPIINTIKELFKK